MIRLINPRKIFISYRRTDTRGYAHAIYNLLVQAFGENDVFMDVDTIRPGDNFVEVLDSKINACDVVLVLIGPKWLDMRDEAGRRRLDNPEDFVRIEIEASLKKGIRVIPILLENASMPGESDLPGNLRPLANRQAFSIGNHLAADVKRLIKFINTMEPRKAKPPPRIANGSPSNIRRLEMRAFLPWLLISGAILLGVLALWPGGPVAAALFPTATITPPFREGPGVGATLTGTAPALTATLLPATQTVTATPPAPADATSTLSLTPAAAFTPTATPEPIATHTSEPAVTDTPEPTRTPTLRPGSTQISALDGMRMAYIPAGSYQMGSNNGSRDEEPVHTVTLDAFWMDTTEVTNAMYAQCVAAGQCTPPSSDESYFRRSYYGNSRYDKYPVIYIDWNQATTYCAWAGRRLPTEAEWEYAARGGLANMAYPWGDEFDEKKANFCDRNCTLESADQNLDDGYADTAPVGSFSPNGYGLYDMAGNVLEWVSDWRGTYPSENMTNPAGPTSGEFRVARGGSWDLSAPYLRVADRTGYAPLFSWFFSGFRCARSP